MADNYLSRVGKAVARGVPQMATGFVDLAGLPFTATGLLEPEQVFGSTAYLTDKGLLPQPQTGLLDETLEMGSAMLNPGVAATGLIGLGIKAAGKGQKYTSAATSINKDKLPAVFTKLTKEEKFAPGSRNIDIGGGKFDNASEHLAKQDVENLVFDPYNRSADHNKMVLDSVRGKPADTATVSNVLNVIPDEANQLKTLETAYKSLKDDGEVFITVYEGNKSGVGKATGSDQFQQNKKLSGYLDTVRKVFPNATVKGGMIRATK